MLLIEELNATINGLVWGFPMMILIVGTGIFLTIGTKFLQFSKFGYIMKNTISRAFEKESVDKGAISPVQALTTALAATVGTGNIAGIAGAIALGGPGAIFWMWVCALFGMATKYAEVTLAIHYRDKNAKGEWVGGPMYYIKNGLDKRFHFLGTLFAWFACLAAFGIGNMTQANTIADSVSSALVQFSPTLDGNQSTISLVVGVVLCSLVALSLLGGIQRIGSITERLVPGMAMIYILGCLFVIISNLQDLGNVLSSIVQAAFDPSAVVGAGAGISIMVAVRNGVGRGVFSNEAGLGSAPIAHASAQTRSAVRQGFFGVFEVFADTIVICTLTALTILSSGTPIVYGEKAGADLTIAAFTQTFGGQLASFVVAVGISLFAFTTILSWGFYGSRCVSYLFGESLVKPYQVLFSLMVIVGATMELDLAWAIADTLNGLMAIPNLIALILLSGTVFKLTHSHFANLKK